MSKTPLLRFIDPLLLISFFLLLCQIWLRIECTITENNAISNSRSPTFKTCIVLLQLPMIDSSRKALLQGNASFNYLGFNYSMMNFGWREASLFVWLSANPINQSFPGFPVWEISDFPVLITTQSVRKMSGKHSLYSTTEFQGEVWLGQRQWNVCRLAL